MGNNSAFSAFEEVTVAVYDAGVLDIKLLKKLAKCFSDQDADSGGYSGTLAKDGKDLLRIVAEVFGKKLPPHPGKLPRDYTKWTDEQAAANDAYVEASWKTFGKCISLR
jgi:hypothetical protein